MSEIYLVTASGYDFGDVLGWSDTLEGAKAIGDAHFNGHWSQKRRDKAQEKESAGSLRRLCPSEGWTPEEGGFRGEVLKRPLYIFGRSLDADVHEWIYVHRLSVNEYVGLHQVSA